MNVPAPRCKSGRKTILPAASGFGERLREARLKAGLSARDLADCGTAAKISRYEAGKVTPTEGTVRHLAAKLHVSYEWLLGDMQPYAHQKPAAPGFGAQLRAARLRAGLGRSDLKDICSSQYISGLETGYCPPSERIERLLRERLKF